MKETVLAERNEEILIRLDGEMEIGNKIYRTKRHEWWTDRAMKERGIHGADGLIYCRGFSGMTDEEVIRTFNGLLG